MVIKCKTNLVPFCRSCAQILRHMLGDMKYLELKDKTELKIITEGVKHCLKCEKPIVHEIAGNFCRICKATISDYERNHLEQNAT